MATRKKIITAATASRLTNTRIPFVDTNGDLTDDADLTFSGDTLTGTKIASTNFKTSSGTTTLYDDNVYGSMYADDVSLTVTVSATATYYAVGTGLLDGGQNGFTYTATGSTLTALVAGKYIATWGMTLTCASPNQEVSGAVMINTTAQMQTEGATKLTSANDNKHVSGSGIITLVANDVVKLSVENETATNNLVVTHTTLTLLRIDN